MDKILKDAQQKFNEACYEEVIELCERVLRVKPENSRAKYLRDKARLARFKQTILLQYSDAMNKLDFEGARKALNLLEQYEGATPELQEKKALVDKIEKAYYQGLKAYEAGDFSLAYLKFKEVAGLYPGIEKVDTLIDLARKHMQYEDYIFQAREAIEKKEYKRGMELYEKALELLPGSEEAQQELINSKIRYYREFYKQSGDRCYRAGDWQNAIKAYTSYLKYDKDNVKIKELIHKCKINIEVDKLKEEGKRLLASENLSGAKDKFLAALALAPEDTEAEVFIKEIEKQENINFHIQKLEMHIKQQDWVNAYIDLKNVLNLDPHNKIALTKKPIIEKELKKKELLEELAQLKVPPDFDKKISILKELINLEPDNDSYRHNLESVLLAQEIYNKKAQAKKMMNIGEYKSAMRILRELDKQTDDSEVDSLINRVRNEIDFLKYMKAYQSAQEKNELETAVLFLKKAYNIKKNEELFHKIEKLEVDIAIENSLQSAKKAYILGDYEKSKKMINRVLKLSPENKEALEIKEKIERKEQVLSLVRQAKSYEEQERFDLALDVYKKALELEPGNKQILDLLESAQEKYKSRVYYDSGVKAFLALNNKKAIDYFSKALEFDSSFSRARKYLKQAEKSYKITQLIEDGRRAFILLNDTAALEKFNQVLKLDPTNMEAKRYIDRIYKEREKKRKFAQAERLLKELDLNSAIKLLRELNSEYPSDKLIKQRLEEAIRLKREILSRQNF